MTRVTFKVSGVGVQAESIRSKLPMSRVEGGCVLPESPLPQDQPLNEQLVWLWGMLKHERRMLKSLAHGGASLSCECKVSKGTIRLQPNGAEMLHLLGVELIVEAK
jgi:hypothetical protein